MQLLVFTVIGTIAFLIAYAFGLGGTVSALVFLAFIGVGITLRAAEPILTFLRG